MDVYEEIKAERARQDAKWGGPAHDDCHDNREWADLLVTWGQHARDSARFIHLSRPWREVLVKTASLAVAAIESYDRRAARHNAGAVG